MQRGEAIRPCYLPCYEHIVPAFVWNSGTLEVSIFHIDGNINKLGNSSELTPSLFANQLLGTVPNAQ